jgi:hypothetical protein
VTRLSPFNDTFLDDGQPFHNRDKVRVADHPPGTVGMLFPGRELTVGEGSALSDLDNVTVRIADVAANLAVLGDRFSDELGSSTFP